MWAPESFDRGGVEPGSALRCSIWNGYDLTSDSGVTKLKKLIREVRPVHIWVSCDCGPYIPPFKDSIVRLRNRGNNLRKSKPMLEGNIWGALRWHDMVDAVDPKFIGNCRSVARPGTCTSYKHLWRSSNLGK